MPSFSVAYHVAVESRGETKVSYYDRLPTLHHLTGSDSPGFLLIFFKQFLILVNISTIALSVLCHYMALVVT